MAGWGERVKDKQKTRKRDRNTKKKHTNISNIFQSNQKPKTMKVRKTELSGDINWNVLKKYCLRTFLKHTSCSQRCSIAEETPRQVRKDPSACVKKGEAVTHCGGVVVVCTAINCSAATKPNHHQKPKRCFSTQLELSKNVHLLFNMRAQTASDKTYLRCQARTSR